MQDILDIIKNVETLYSTNSSLSILKDMERVLDELNIYVYDNWIDGEIVKGPNAERHWISAVFMWPVNKMPDTQGAKRLADYGCKIRYKKSVLLKPRKIRTPDDLRPGTKKGKLDRHQVWIVEIIMPRNLVSDIYNGYMSKMRDEMGIGRTERVDAAPAQAADQAATEGLGAAPVGAGPALGAAPGAVPGGAV